MADGLIHLGNQIYNLRNTRAARPPGGDRPWYSESVTVRKVDENSTAITATNTASETTLASMTLPALTLYSTGAARISAVGTMSKNTAGTYTIRVKLADQSSTATVLATTAFTPASSTSEHAWGLEAWLFGKQPTENRSWGVFDVSVAGSRGTMSPSTFSVLGWSTSSLDETEEWTVSITAQMSAASTALSVSRQVAILEGIN